MMPESVPNSREEKETAIRRKILGVKIRHARIRSGLNLKEVGEALGVSSGLISDIGVVSIFLLYAIRRLCRVGIILTPNRS